jgi:hypothetical protein
VAAFLKVVDLPAPIAGERAPELLWVTTTGTRHPKNDVFPKCKVLETKNLHVCLNRRPPQSNRRPTLRHGRPHINNGEGPPRNPLLCYRAPRTYRGGRVASTTLEGLVESFSFSEIKKRILTATFCTVLCDMVSDKTTILELGVVILPLERHSIIVTFASTTDDTARTALPKELRLALKHHKDHISKGSLTLQVASSIPAHRTTSCRQPSSPSFL